MPFGNKNDSVSKILWDSQSNMKFEFTDEEILPPEQKEILRRVLEENLKYGSLKSVNHSETINKEELLNKIMTKIQEANGRIRFDFVDSSGGSHNGKSKTNYVVMQVNDVIILEPFGQPDNATLIANRKTPNLIESIQKMGRREAVDKGIIARINHTRIDEKYDYGSDHIIQIIDFAENKPKELLSELKKLMSSQTSCSLATLSEALNKEKDFER